MIRAAPRSNMSAMRYALTAPERTFKEAVREFAERALPGANDGRLPCPDMPEALCRELETWLSAAKPAGLSLVEEVVALEEIIRRCPASGPGLIGSGLFGSSCPALCRAAADLGAAQGVLARGLGAASKPEGLRRAVLQELADALAGIEAARLKLYRAAILEESGRGQPDETAGAERLARDLAREAGDLGKRIMTGGNHET